MKKVVLLLTLLLLSVVAFTPGAAYADEGGDGGHEGRIVVANRGSGSISVIDARSNALVGTFALPAGDNMPEPMYLTYSRHGDHVFVGDRANDRVVAFNAGDYSVAATIPTGAGVFHMWSDPHDRFLWVNNDGDATATVIDPQTFAVVATVPMPADLVADGFIPHDVIIEPQARFAYVTMLSGEGDVNYLVQFSMASFEEVNRAAVGLDPHVSLTRRNKLIYVPAQNSDVVTVLNRDTLQPETEIAVPGAHGAGMSPNGKVFYTTNLPGGGTDGLFAIDTRSNTIIGSVDTPYAVPHNIVVTKNKKLFLTHSGATSDKVKIYAVSTEEPLPSLMGEVTVGLNPFGIAYIP